MLRLPCRKQCSIYVEEWFVRAVSSSSWLRKESEREEEEAELTFHPRPPPPPPPLPPPPAVTETIAAGGGEERAAAAAAAVTSISCVASISSAPFCWCCCCCCWSQVLSLLPPGDKNEESLSGRALSKQPANSFPLPPTSDGLERTRGRCGELPAATATAVAAAESEPPSLPRWRTP